MKAGVSSLPWARAQHRQRDEILARWVDLELKHLFGFGMLESEAPRV